MEKLNDTGRKHQCTESCVLVIAKKQHSPLSFPFFFTRVFIFSSTGSFEVTHKLKIEKSK